MTTLPSAIGDWSIARVTAGLWLSEAAGPVPPPVLGLTAEPGRPSVIVDADAPSPRTDRLLAELFPLLSSAGLTAVRLVLSFAADRYAQQAAQAYALDLIAAEAEVTITPHGYAIVRLPGPVPAGTLPQWRRYLPNGESLLVGMLSPSPPWERGLIDELNAGPESHLTVHRVPAGIAAHLPGQAAGFASAAAAIWPDPKRLMIVVNDAGDDGTLLDGLTALLRQLPMAAVAGVRLWWPRAVTRVGSAALQEMARRCGTELTVPAADVSVNEGFGGVCHGPSGAAPWLRFSPDGDVQLMGSLYPEPGWEQALANVELTPAAGLVIEHVAAGLAVYRPERSGPSLAATARSIIPDPARATIIVGGDATDEVVRQDLEAVVGGLSTAARRSLRIALTRAGSGGPQAYAQALADTFESVIVAPTGTWTATPDGRLLARAAPDGTHGPPSEAYAWREFAPRYGFSTSGQVGRVADRAAQQRQHLGQPPLGQSGRASTAPGQLGQRDVSRPGPGPVPEQPSVSRPRPSQQAASRPEPGQPAASQREPSQSAASRPAPGKHGIPGLGPGQPRVPESGPGPGQPRVPGPGSGPGQHGVPGPGRPVPGQLGVSRPMPGQPSAGQPAPGQPGAFEPGLSRPPAPPTVPQPPATFETPGESGGGRAASGGEERAASGGEERAASGGEREAASGGEQSAASGGEVVDSAPEAEAARPESPARLPMLPRDHRSSVEERRLYRESAHTYQGHAVTARRMLTQRPGLRAVAAGEPVDAVITDFAAVLDFLGDDPREVAERLRAAGSAGDPRVACVLSGLRRLPSFAGAVFSSARFHGRAAAAYVPCKILIEPSFVSATSSVLVAMEGDISYVIWSQTGRRVAALAADAGRDEILFAAGTTYKILRVYDSKPGSQMRVFLRELAGSRSVGSHRRGADDLPLAVARPDEQPDDMDNKVLERLVTAASLRDDALADENVLVSRAGSPMPPIGLDDNGVPFAQALGV